MILMLSMVHLDAQNVASDDHLLRTIAADCKGLDALLKDDWIVVSSKNEITLTSRFEVFQIAYSNPPRSPRLPEFSGSSRDLVGGFRSQVQAKAARVAPWNSL